MTQLDPYQAKLERLLADVVVAAWRCPNARTDDLRHALDAVVRHAMITTPTPSTFDRLTDSASCNHAWVWKDSGGCNYCRKCGAAETVSEVPK